MLAFLALGAGEALAQPAGTFFTDAKTRCKLWWPLYGTGDSVVSVQWKGACIRGFAQGRGTFEVVTRHLNGDRPAYTVTSSGEGDFVDGKLTGRGFYNDSNGYRTEGEFRDGLLEGRGITISTSNSRQYRFEGEFHAGQRWGWGVDLHEYSEDGKTYWARREGEFRSSMNGRGILVQGRVGCKVEQRYEGEWKDGGYHGRGTLTTYSGKKYAGTWNNSDLGNRSRMDLEESTEKLDELCGDRPAPRRSPYVMPGLGRPG